MLRIFTIKFKESIESFNDSFLSDFLIDKNIIKWEGNFFEIKNDRYWTVLVEYEPLPVSNNVNENKKRQGSSEEYKDILSDDDWPLFKRLREWRGEKSKKEGVPPYIILTNKQMARISAIRPNSLNGLQEIEGIGNAKRAKYGKYIIEMVASSNSLKDNSNGEDKDA